ncbi:MAG: ABC transporter substrate-binding protein [Bacteroidetes bacterium]|nr:ABC transporter substrate-binding protein [Bacteroidota bacterium]
MRFTAALALSFGILSACNHGGENSGSAPGKSSSFTEYASRFDVSTEQNYTLLRVYDPWQNSRGVTYSYVLGANKELVPDSLSGFPFIHTPVKRVVAMSTTHVAMIAGLGETGSIIGASGTAFIYNPEIRERYDSGLLTDVGYGQGLNYEMVVTLEPDVVFLYGVEGNVTTTAGKLRELGITVVYCAEYLEPYPLGKAEWIRFFARFYGRELEADILFNRVDSTYNALKEAVSGVKEKPEVMTGLPWKDTWYVAGGESFASKLISDAGGSYIWRDNPSEEAVPYDLESVFSRAVNADIWINPGNAGSLNELTAFDERFGELPVVRQGSVFNNNARMSGGGGNDYWESGTVRPDLVLADLISVFHPALLADQSMFYYMKLK